MKNTTFSILFLSILSYGGGLLTMALIEPSSTPQSPMPTVVLRQTANPASISGASQAAPTVSRQARVNRSSVIHDDASPQPESLFWQTMAMLQKEMNGDTLEVEEMALASDAIDYLDNKELEKIIHTYTHLAPHDYPQNVDVREFAKRLGELYYRNSQEVWSSSLDSQQIAGLVEFDRQIETDNIPKEPQEEFSEDTRRIYAVFDTADYTKNSVMVKWSRVDSSEVLIYDKYPINTNTTNNYIWLERPDGWRSGDYQVEIFSLEDNLSLLAKGEYKIWSTS